MTLLLSLYPILSTISKNNNDQTAKTCPNLSNTAQTSTDASETHHTNTQKKLLLPNPKFSSEETGTLAKPVLLSSLFNPEASTNFLFLRAFEFRSPRLGPMARRSTRRAYSGRQTGKPGKPIGNLVPVSHQGLHRLEFGLVFFSRENNQKKKG